MTTRTTVEDCELGGVFIPKDTKIDVDIYNLHRNPRVWSNPDEFIPDRYAPGGEAERQPGSGLAWVPFRYVYWSMKPWTRTRIVLTHDTASLVMADVSV